MSFGHREFLWLLLLVPALGALSVRAKRLRAEAWRSISQRGTAPTGRSLSMLMAVLVLILALARPRFGTVALASRPPGHDVTIAVDVSRSMAAEDAVPNRLAAAVSAAESLIAALASDPDNRAAIVAFAGRGVIRSPLTENLGAVMDELHRLTPGSVQPGGTDLAAGLDAALETFGEEEHEEGRSIVIFSDGEDLAGRWQSQLDRLASAGVIVHAVAIGDGERSHPVPSGFGSQPLLFQGQPVMSQRCDTALEAITRRTDGVLVRLGLASTDLGALFRSRIAPVAKIKRAAARVPERPERFPLFLAAALGFVLAGCWPLGRIDSWRWVRVQSRVAAVLFLGSGLLVALGAGQSELIDYGNAAYSAGRLVEALAAFEAAIVRAPESPIPRYNAAATLFALRRFDEAIGRYAEARQRADPILRTKIDFALGNSALMAGNLQDAVQHYDQCRASMATGDALDTVRQDAAINRKFALEQAFPAPTSKAHSDRQKSSSRRPLRGPGARKPAQKDGNRTEADSVGSPSGGSGTPSETIGDNRGVKGRQRTGGGGDFGKASSGSAGRSPDERLDLALEHIREAQRRRLPQETSLAPSGDGHKNW